jgi:drug/metabolite transporter (DMT)-like permease
MAWLRRRSWDFSLLGVAAIWGYTFPIVKCALERCPRVTGGLGLAGIAHPTTPMTFIGLRFALATAVLAPAFRRLDPRLAGLAAASGLALFAGYAFQTLGLQRTTASNVGFVTGLYVVIVPIVVAVQLGRLPGRATFAGVALATAGLFLLASPSGLGLGTGETLVLGAAACFALHLVLTAHLVVRTRPSAVAAIQMAVVASAALVWGFAGERSGLPREGPIWAALAVNGFAAGALAFLVMTAAQRRVPPTRTALILTMESPFAGLFGALMLGERLGRRGFAGAGLILAGIVLVELVSPAPDKASDLVATAGNEVR